MLNRYMSLWLLLGVYAMQCAQPQTEPLLAPEQVALCRHQMQFNLQNWDKTAASIAGNLFGRYPDITCKELVGFFRCSDEQGRQRTCVLPLPMIQRIWEYIDELKLIERNHTFVNRILPKFNIDVRSSTSASGTTPEGIAFAYRYKDTRYGHQFIGTITTPLYILQPLSGGINTGESHLFLLYSQTQAHAILADRGNVVVVPHVALAYVEDQTTQQEVIQAIHEANERKANRRFETIAGALSYIKSLPQ